MTGEGADKLTRAAGGLHVSVLPAAYNPGMNTFRLVLLCLPGLLLACAGDDPLSLTGAVCAPGADPLVFEGDVAAADARQYRLQPFSVVAGTGRVEVAYGWAEAPGLPATPLTSTTLDLGLWDADGVGTPAGFRGWGGSRQGRLDRDQPPVFVEAGVADRGFQPGAIEPGEWNAELGIAAVSPQGARWRLEIACTEARGPAATAADPVDRGHVARHAPGWYHGDFHMHAFHSQPNGPDDSDFIAQSRAAGLDFLMVTEYVTGRHWETLGMTQRLNPDLLIWPGREIITYHGHVNTHGETRSVLEYRHGAPGVDIRAIQRQAKADGALFQVNHPTTFPGPVFQNFCRGCAFELGDAIDWAQVDTLEVLNGPILNAARDFGLPLPGQIEQPFTTTAIWLWEAQLRAGHRITAVSGSDSKGVDAPEDRARKGYGSSATAVFANELSRSALRQAIQAGHAYIRTRGVAGSPEVLFEGETSDGQTAIYGDTLALGDGVTATLRTTVTGGAGQVLTYFRNGAPVAAVPVLTDPFVHQRAATRGVLAEGPLGTIWRIELRDLQSRTIIGNPIFLQGSSP